MSALLFITAVLALIAHGSISYSFYKRVSQQRESGRSTSFFVIWSISALVVLVVVGIDSLAIQNPLRVIVQLAIAAWLLVVFMMINLYRKPFA